MKRVVATAVFVLLMPIIGSAGIVPMESGALPELQIRPVSFQDEPQPISNYQGSGSPRPLPAVAADRILTLRLPDLQFNVPAGWAVQPLLYEEPREFRIALENPRASALTLPLQVNFAADPIGEMLSWIDMELDLQHEDKPKANYKTIKGLDLEAFLRQSLQEGVWSNVEISAVTVAGHPAARLHGTIKMGESNLNHLTVIWICPRSDRFFSVDITYGDSFPANDFISAMLSGLIDHDVKSGKFDPVVAGPELIAGETLATFDLLLADEGSHTVLPYRFWRVVDGGESTQVTSSTPVWNPGVQGFFYDHRPGHWPGREIQFPITAGKEWKTEKGETVEVLTPVLLDAENVYTLPLLFRKEEKVLRKLYYAPALKTVVRVEDAEGRATSVLWLSAIAP